MVEVKVGGGGLHETSGSPKTHFCHQPRFLSTTDDHDNERISFPALFCSKNESGILSAAGSGPVLTAVTLNAVKPHLKVRPVTGT